MDTYLSVAEAALVAGVTETSVRNWIQAGHLPIYRRVGNKRYLIRADDLAAFLEPRPVELAG